MNEDKNVQDSADKALSLSKDVKWLFVAISLTILTMIFIHVRYI